MKTKSVLGLAAAAMLVLGSCATSNEVNGGGVFQKRKYTKGFYWNKGTSANESASLLKSEKLNQQVYRPLWLKSVWLIWLLCCMPLEKTIQPMF